MREDKVEQEIRQFLEKLRELDLQWECNRWGVIRTARPSCPGICPITALYNKKYPDNPGVRFKTQGNRLGLSTSVRKSIMFSADKGTAKYRSLMEQYLLPC